MLRFGRLRALRLLFGNSVGGVAPPTSFLLMESIGYILMEDGVSKIGLEA